MGTEPIKFHQVHGQNIRLSNDGTEASRTESFNQALCFTNRPVEKNEELVVKVLSCSSTWSGTLRVGVTEHNPNEFAQNLPKYLCPDLNMQPGNWGKALEEDHVRLNQEITIFHQNGRVMIRDGDRAPEEFLTGVPSNKPLYVLFDIYGNTKSIRISLAGQRPPCPLPAPVATDAASEPIISKAFGNVPFSPARFHDYASDNVKVCSKSASSERVSTPKCHFAVTKSLLTTRQTLVVRLEKLRNAKPIQMVLTTESPTAVYKHGNIDNLCDKSYSIPVKSDRPVAGEELAISIAPNGLVYISHNNRSWIEQIHLDPDLQYSVVFDMENIGKMSVVGITSALEPMNYTQKAAPPEKPASPDSSGNLPPDCIICLETPRNVLLEPCNHYALCEDCWRKLEKTPKPLCPSCRAVIKGVRKIYMI